MKETEFDWLDKNYRPRIHSHHRFTSEVVDILIDEVTEQSKQLSPGKMSIYFRSLLFDIVTQVSLALDRLLTQQIKPGELQRLAVKLNAALTAAYEFAGLTPAVPSKTLRALSQIGGLMTRKMAQ
jgi:hypothetical protein